MKHLVRFLYWLSEVSEKWATILWLRECRRVGVPTPHTMFANYFQSNAEKIAANVFKNNKLLKALRSREEHEEVELFDDVPKCFNTYEK